MSRDPAKQAVTEKAGVLEAIHFLSEFQLFLSWGVWSEKITAQVSFSENGDNNTYLLGLVSGFEEMMGKN